MTPRKRSYHKVSGYYAEKNGQLIKLRKICDECVIKEANAAYKKAIDDTGDANMAKAQNDYDAKNALFVAATGNRESYAKAIDKYVEDKTTLETSWAEMNDTKATMVDLASKGKAFEKDSTGTKLVMTADYQKAYNSYVAAADVAKEANNTIDPSVFANTNFTGDLTNADTVKDNSDLRNSLYGKDQKADNEGQLYELNKVAKDLNKQAADIDSNLPQLTIINKSDTAAKVKELAIENKNNLGELIDSVSKQLDTASETLDKLNAEKAGLQALKDKYDAAVKAEADALAAKNNAATAASDAAKKAKAAQDAYDKMVTEQAAVKNLDDADVAELQRFGKYNTYAILGVDTLNNTVKNYGLNTDANDVELTALEGTLRSAQDYVAATQKAKDAKDAAADEMHKASNILTRKKAAWRLGTPSIKVTSKKGAVKVSWKKVKHASKYKLRVKKGNGSYKTYYTSKTSKTFKVKKGTKVKVKVRAQKGTKVSHYSGYKAARAK